MELNQQNVNVIAVVWENDVLVPVALRWNFWTGSSGGRKIIIIPTKGIVIQKLKKAIGTKERRSSFKSKQRQPDKRDLYYDFKTRHASSSSPSQIYKLYQTHVSETKQSSAFDYPPKPARRPYLWSSREIGDSTKAQPVQQVGTAGGPSSASEPTKTQPSQKVGTTDGPSSRGPTKTQSGKEFGTAGSPPSSSGPMKTQPPQKVGTADSPSSRGPTKAQPPQKVRTTDSPPSRGPTKTQTGQRGGTPGGPSSNGPPKKHLDQQVGGTVNKPSSSASTQPKPEFSQFEKECLAEHNKYRAIHGAPPLTLSRNLCQYSQEWANRLSKMGRMEHRTEGKYGENLYMSSGMKVDARTPVKSWYDEIKFYKYGSDFSSNTGHFTQVVWKGSKELGCAFAQKGNEIIVVANYSPPGNVQGQFSENVLPPKN